MLCNVTLPSCCHIFHLNIYLDIVYVFVSWPGLLFHILCVYSLMVGGQLVIHLLSKSWIFEWRLILSFCYFVVLIFLTCVLQTSVQPPPPFFYSFWTQFDFAVIAFWTRLLTIEDHIAMFRGRGTTHTHTLISWSALN